MIPKKDLSLKENNSHGDFLLPIMKYHCRIPEHFTLLPLHWHEEMEFTLIQEGTALYHINLESYEVKAGDLIIITPFILHDIHQNPSSSMTSDTFVFNLSMLNLKTPDACSIKYLAPIFDSQYTFPYIVRSKDAGYPRLLALFHQLNLLYTEQKEGFELGIKATLFEFFSVLFSEGLAQKNYHVTLNNSHPEKLKLVLDYIGQNLSKPLTIKELASICHFSDYYFMNFFKKYTGMTCVQYINTQRLELAADYLHTKNLPIMDIALEVGFDNISYFNKLFKAKYHTTPKEYRSTCKALYVQLI